MNALLITAPLPSSRLNDSRESVMADWPIDDGMGNVRMVRLELVPLFCFNCGAPNGYTPKDTISFASWMCQPCAEVWGDKAALHTCQDQDFWDKVEEEMIARWGRALTQGELEAMAHRGELGRALELLEKESPYTLPSQSLTSPVHFCGPQGNLCGGAGPGIEWPSQITCLKCRGHQDYQKWLAGEQRYQERMELLESLQKHSTIQGGEIGREQIAPNSTEKGQG